ncbi:glutathione peroxidase [Ottowia thiooxydans]|uniref:glutathione peroxidase n=1 Tax=Ottowia thiooxydans TaxID=219182 RepID=UPI000409DE1E|nr:glutathione peroxidase [Ottowia thiooxydans]
MTADTKDIGSFTVTKLEGQPLPLSELAGQVMLIVNTASACGFTPQFAGLQALHEKYAAQGLSVLGFPCNQFGGQDPGDNAEIGAFCQRNYGVDFPMMSKIEVNGAGADPLFTWLKAEAPGLLGSQAIKWNFTKFLVGRNGEVIRRYAPLDKPESLTGDIEAALAA